MTNKERVEAAARRSQRLLVVDGEVAYSCEDCGGYPERLAKKWDAYSAEPTLVCKCRERVRSAAHQARSAALYSHVVAERYSRLVESSEPADAMRCAIGEAEEVVRVWEEVVNGK